MRLAADLKGTSRVIAAVNGPGGMAVLFPGGIIASDAMPWLSSKSGQEIDPNAWPLPDDAFPHPRSAGTFTRFLAQYVRTGG